MDFFLFIHEDRSVSYSDVSVEKLFHDPTPVGTNQTIEMDGFCTWQIVEDGERFGEKYALVISDEQGRAFYRVYLQPKTLCEFTSTSLVIHRFMQRGRNGFEAAPAKTAA